MFHGSDNFLDTPGGQAADALKHPWLELTDEKLKTHDLGKNKDAMRKWNQKRKLKRVYNAVVASNRMKNLLEGVKSAAGAEAEAEVTVNEDVGAEHV